jgi:hypothetical protein
MSVRDAAIGVLIDNEFGIDGTDVVVRCDHNLSDDVSLTGREVMLARTCFSIVVRASRLTDMLFLRVIMA